MSELKSLPEVLAPAGSAQALQAALLCGADAVYLGLDAFNARRGAQNFTMENLAHTVQACHIRGVKVYLTLNILLLENELGEFLKVARAACEAGVDAVIVQDMGVAALLRRCCPDLRLHASTQMVVHNAEGARVLEDVGFSRVVLARECSAREIEKIKNATSLEVEVFVHGALCMSVSGQCYMSAVLGQRSGNRGLCAQPCRLAFAGGVGDHALSLKDMSHIPHIQELGRLGVCSLKIEGRMKRPEYVAAAVTACRAALAGEQPDMESLRAVFSRSGFTDGYFTGKLGEPMFGVRVKEDVSAAAGVLGQLETLYTDPRRHVRRVTVSMDFIMRKDTPVSLAVTDMDGNCAKVLGEIPQVALHKPTDAERVRANLTKTGGTPYLVQSVDCSIDDGLVLPVSALNAMRRAALEQLDTLRGKTRAIVFNAAAVPVVQNKPTAPRPELRVRLDSAEQLSDEMRHHAQLITLPVPEFVRLCKAGMLSDVDKLCAGLPRIQFSGQEHLREQLAFLRNHGIFHAAAGNLCALAMAKEAGFTVHGEPFLNVVNSHAAAQYKALGIKDLCLSFELSLAVAKTLSIPLARGLTVYGHLPVMTVRNCPVKLGAGCRACAKGNGYLTDRKGEKLYASCAYGCSELLNPLPLYMGDRLAELNGLDFAELRFTKETPAQCALIFSEYLHGGQPPERFTRGLLYKTIL